MSAGTTAPVTFPTCASCGQIISYSWPHQCPNSSFLVYPQLPNHNAEILAELRAIRMLLQQLVEHTHKTG